MATNKIGLRITLKPTDRYCYVNMAYMWVNIPGHTCNVFTEYSTIGAKTTFIKLNNGKTYNINGWSGGNMLYFPGGTFGGGAGQTSNRYAYRFTYLCKSINETYKTTIIFITHDHYDHYSEEDLDKVIKENTTIVIPEELSPILQAQS